MGKRLTQQARGRGGPAFTVRRAGDMHRIGYPSLHSQGKAQVTKVFSSAGHSAPLVEIKINGESFIVPAAQGVYEGQEVYVGRREDNKKHFLSFIHSLCSRNN